MGRWQNRIKQVLYRPSKSGIITSAAIEATIKLMKEWDKGTAKKEEGKKEDKR